MKLNPDCMRDILLCMEDVEYQHYLPIAEIYSLLSKYSENEINYSILKLDEAGFIDATITPYDGGVMIIDIEDITYQGHQFLANIHSETVWKGVKQIAGKVGSTSINAIVQIASGVITELIKSQFGLTPS